MDQSGGPRARHARQPGCIAATSPIGVARKPSAFWRVRQQRLNLASQRFVVSAGRCHKRGPLLRIPVERSVAEILDTPPALGVGHRCSCPSSSRSSQSFASRQSRLTVSGDTWSTSAVSSTLKPPKNRNSMIRLLRTSTFANASSARSSATTSNAGPPPRRALRAASPVVRRPRVSGIPDAGHGRRGRAASAAPRCQESARGPASGRAGRRSASGMPH